MRRLIVPILAIVALVVTGLAVDFARFVGRPLAASVPTVVTIPDGAGFRQAVSRLERAGLFAADRHGHYFTAYALARGDTGRIKSGEYQFAPGATPGAVLDKLVAGKTRRFSLTVVEGWRFARLREALAEHEAIDATLADKPASAVMQAIDAEGEDPEGRFLPDTYQFPRGTTDVAFLKRAHARMQKLLAQQWPKRADDLPLDSPYQALILASIVEKETALAEERPRIAGVFTRRLARGMPLQTDPTVIYGIEDFDGNLRRSDLEHDGPYNTYQRTGLPPTPIALPGGAAIRAALHPAQGKALYFVATGDGDHVFSATYQQHAQAVRKHHQQ